MNTLTSMKQPVATNLVTVMPGRRNLQPCTESHQKALKHFEENAVAESLPKTRLFRVSEVPAKPPFLSTVLQLLLRHGFDEQKIRVGITGYGAVKSHLAEIGLVSTKAGFYNLHLGGNGPGTQLNRLYRLHLSETEVLAELGRLLPSYKITRQPGERFGEFVSRKKLI